MFIIQGHRFAHNGRVMNIILGADYADYTDLFLYCNERIRVIRVIRA